jgi:hypothetical protein
MPIVNLDQGYPSHLCLWQPFVAKQYFRLINPQPAARLDPRRAAIPAL